MTIVLNPTTGVFFDDGKENKPAPKLLYGDGEPMFSLGDEGDFYLDTSSYKLRQKKKRWNEGKRLIGADGKDGKDGKDGLPGRDGLDGKDGRDGKDGLNGKDGVPGRDGVDGRDGIDGKDGKDGADGREIELSRNQTHIVYRYVGEKNWRDLFPVPKRESRGGVGGVNKLTELRDTNVVNLQPNQILRFDGARWVNVDESTTHNQSFVSQTSVSVEHSLGYFPLVQIVDSSGYQLIPLNIRHIDSNNFTVTFTTSTSGSIIYG